MEVPLCQVGACVELSDVDHAVAFLMSAYSLSMHLTVTVCARCKLKSEVHNLMFVLVHVFCDRETFFRRNSILSLGKHMAHRDSHTDERACSTMCSRKMPSLSIFFMSSTGGCWANAVGIITATAC